MSDNEQPQPGHAAAREPGITAARLARIRARVDAATPGPWINRMSFVTARGHVLVATGDTQGRQHEENMDLIAHAPGDLSSLLAFAESALPILRELAASGSVEAHNTVNRRCMVCHAFGHEPLEHHEGCLAAQARALLAGMPEGAAAEGEGSEP